MLAVAIDRKEMRNYLHHGICLPLRGQELVPFSGLYTVVMFGSTDNCKTMNPFISFLNLAYSSACHTYFPNPLVAPISTTDNYCATIIMFSNTSVGGDS